MRKGVNRVGAVLVTTLLFSCTSTSISLADPTPTPSPTATSFQDAMTEYKIARENFNAALKSRAASIKLINKNFNDAINKANSDFNAGLSQAKTPAQKFQLASTRLSAKSAAIAARDAAIQALGPMPVEPVEPVAPYAAKNGMKSGKGKKK